MHIAIILSVIVFSLITLCGLAGFLYACLRSDRDFTNYRDPQDADDCPRVKYAVMCEQAAKRLFQEEHDDISILSHDGKKLCAHLFSNGQSDRFVIVVHGYHSFPEFDFGCIAEDYYNAGYGVLMIVQRAHHESGGRLITYGAKESRDVSLWCRELVRRFPGCRILLHGVSMGGATVILSSSAGLPDNVRGIIDDCGYSNAYDEISYISKKAFGLPRALTAIANIWSIALTGVSLRCSVQDAARTCRLPKLFIHGCHDAFVPYSMGKANFDSACEPKKMISIPDAGHAIAYYYSPDVIRAEMLDFAKGTIG